MANKWNPGARAGVTGAQVPVQASAEGTLKLHQHVILQRRFLMRAHGLSEARAKAIATLHWGDVS